jgi:hypothetical protein
MATESSSRAISFELAGCRMAGRLHVPASNGPHPALVIDGPLTSVKEQVAGNYAKAIAGRGFVTLAFDHRHFGESDGEPRQYEHPGRKVEDLRAAVDYLQSLPDVAPERIGAVGVCAGAGYVARAVAEDERIRAFGAVAGFFHDAEQQRQWMKDGFDAAITRARRARELYEATGEVLTIPAVGKEGDVAMPLAEAFAYYGTPRGAVPGYTNAFAVMSREHTLPWDAQRAARAIRVPSLIIHAENALAPALARKFFAALAGPKQEIWVESSGQIDFYDLPERVEHAADCLAEHFERSW